MDYLREILSISQGIPLPLILALTVSAIVGISLLVCLPNPEICWKLAHCTQFYLALFIVAPIPRPPLRSEKTYRTIEPGEYSGDARPLPCWQDNYNAQKEAARRRGDSTEKNLQVEEAEVFMSLVVPAYNEEERLGIMLTEAVEYLQHAYGSEATKTHANGNRAKRKDATQEISNGYAKSDSSRLRGWEILVVSDGSTDKTINTALQFARDLGGKGASCIRVISLHENRGKGGAVTHGMRHVRGQYAIFADADGASKFEDLGKLVRASKKIEDAEGRGVAVGSRAHLVGSEAVVKVHETPIPPSFQSRPNRSFAAFIPPQPPHALLPSPPPPPDPSRHSRHPGYPMRLQALLSPIATIHNTLHALRRLDLRR